MVVATGTGCVECACSLQDRGCLQPNPFRQGCMVSFTSVLRHYSRSEKTSCRACSRHLSRRRTTIAIQVSIAWCAGHPVRFATDIHGESSGLRKSARTWGLQSRVRVAAASLASCADRKSIADEITKASRVQLNSPGCNTQELR